MPRFCSSAPRKKLPPPTTTATCTPVRTTVAIWRARPCTTSGSRPTAPPPKTSPESFSTTRRGRTDGGTGSPTGAACSVTIVMSSAFLRLTPETLCDGEAGRRIAYPTSRTSEPRWLLLLADLEPDEPGDVDAGLLEDLRHGLLGVRHRRLLEQDEVLE